MHINANSSPAGPLNLPGPDCSGSIPVQLSCSTASALHQHLMIASKHTLILPDQATLAPDLQGLSDGHWGLQLLAALPASSENLFVKSASLDDAATVAATPAAAAAAAGSQQPNTLSIHTASYSTHNSSDPSTLCSSVITLNLLQAPLSSLPETQVVGGGLALSRSDTQCMDLLEGRSQNIWFTLLRKPLPNTFTFFWFH